jgi:hypothetical protein
MRWKKMVWMLEYGPYIKAISVEKIIRGTKEYTTLTKLAHIIRKGHIR